ncbi:MAG TPA: CHAP domain-containing protein [Rhizomicrobium sp.]|nr:CHAP domain-containing protein [Rhizomicrobium sp.]
MRAIGKLALVALLGLSLEGCAARIMDYSQTPMPRERGETRVENDTHKPMQCAPYAREHSGIRIFGDAYTWWDKAAGKYPRASLPEPGTVMVLNNYAGDTRGHLAVVRRLVSPREIRVDHANWLDDGSIYVNNPVEDVSSANDWSVVRVFNLQTGSWGSRLYPVQGFIGAGRPDPAEGAHMGAVSLAEQTKSGEIN